MLETSSWNYTGGAAKNFELSNTTMGPWNQHSLHTHMQGETNLGEGGEYSYICVPPGQLDYFQINLKNNLFEKKLVGQNPSPPLSSQLQS